jgi:cbb3-type cytochrome c oxidase subunit III
MRQKENYTPLVAIALGLTLAIFASFQVYALREPTRIADDTKREQLIMITEGRTLYDENCSLCHGEEGEGVDGPALNDSNLLSSTADPTLFSVISSGVPNTEMPAWSQQHGGPFTDQQISQMVAFIRDWEANAPDRQAMAMMGDPVNGLVIFSGTCTICHGEAGSGTELVPSLNDPNRLSQFDDEWFVETISEGRPSKGMPTWGTVLSPIQIRDLVALLRAWEKGETVNLPGPEVYLHEAIHMIGHGNSEAALHELEEAVEVAEGEMLTAIERAIQALNQGDTDAATAAIEEAESLGDHSGMEMDGMDMGEETMQPGQQEALAALDEIKMGMADSALTKLQIALVLAQGELKEAIEHAISDLKAGRVDEAQNILEKALMPMP